MKNWLTNYFARRSSYSLRIRLIAVLSLLSLSIWGLATGIAWWQAKSEVNEIFDAQQVLFAKRLASTDLGELMIKRKIRGGYRGVHHHKAEYDDDALAFAVFTHDGRLLISDNAHGKNIPFRPERGFANMKPIGDDDIWRIFWKPIQQGELWIAVGQELDYRHDIVEEMVLSQMWVWLAGLPLLLALIMLVVNKELKSVQRISAQMRERSPESQGLLTTNQVPTEILPLVTELNSFFDRTSALLQRERRFTSDAAHELRSPLAGLRIQAEIAQMLADDEKLRNEALSNLTQGIDRASQVIEQLLTLSRLDSLQQLTELEKVHWSNLLQSVITEQQKHAEQRQISISFEQIAEPESKMGQSVLLSLMFRNIIDNAIKYCPSQSQIKVRLEKHKIVIEDNGGGVSEEDLVKLGERFYRPAGQNEKGSGLGLSIVKRIAQLHQIQVRLENVKDLQGKYTGLRVIFAL